jgi:hypothetical protein
MTIFVFAAHFFLGPTCRVARWFLFKPKIQIWVNFVGPEIGKLLAYLQSRVTKLRWLSEYVHDNLRLSLVKLVCRTSMLCNIRFWLLHTFWTLWRSATPRSTKQRCTSILMYVHTYNKFIHFLVFVTSG